jgi:transposase
MSRLGLTPRERRGLQRQLVETLDARVLRRTLAVLEFDQGRPARAIAKMLGMTRQSVYNWVEAYRQTRDPTTLNDQPGRGRQRSLDEDEERLLDTFLAVSPQEFGYPHANWTLTLLGETLEWASGHRRSLNSLRRALKRLDYVWKRPRYDLLPDPEQEKKTPNSAANPGFAGAECGVGPRRNRPVDVSPASRGVVETRRVRPSLVEWSQRATGDLRSHEPQDGVAVVPASGNGPKPRFSSLFGRSPRALSGVACGLVAG